MLNSKKIDNLNLHPVTNKVDDSFIGIKIKNNVIDFYYPNTFNLDEENIRYDILSILSTISIAKTLSSEKIKIESSYSNNESLALVSYLWILKDYLINGFYINREKIYKTNQNGRVDWKRTLNTEPIISNGNVIYKDIIVQVHNADDNLIGRIHKYCVKKSIDFIGWLFGINSSNFIEILPFNKSLYINTLKKELSKTFDDVKRLRLKHMLMIIEGLNDDHKQDEIVYGVDSYYYIFEKMIDRIFGSINANKFNPRAKWHLKRNNYIGKSASKLKPDTILIKDNIAYVIDSKYYPFGYTADDRDLPETTSIQKQITYSEFIEKNKLSEEIKNIRNAFILPYNKYKNKFGFNNNLEYIGYSKTDYKDNDKAHEIVYAFLVDLKHVIKTYNKFEHNDDIENIVKEIEKAKKEYDTIKKS